jgi:hypothetical protein
LCIERISLEFRCLFDGEVGGDSSELEIDHPGDILFALDGGKAIFRKPCDLPKRHRAAWRDRDLAAGEGDHALLFKTENVADLGRRHDAERVIAHANLMEG